MRALPAAPLRQPSGTRWALVPLTLEEERAAREHHAALANPPEFHPDDGHAEPCARCGCESREHVPCCKGPCRGTDARDRLPCRCPGYVPGGGS